MKIIIAPDSFKGTLSSMDVCDIVSESIKKHIKDAEIISMPVADGGEGMTDAYLAACGGEKVFIETAAPDFKKVRAFYGILPGGDTAVIEMAAASGLTLTQLRTPLDFTTAGTGELIAHAHNRGCRRIILGLGGSATLDGGIGMASAMGAVFSDAHGNNLTPTARELSKVCSIEAERLVKTFADTQFLIACDVKNVLCGEKGAARVFGPQKGATEKDVLLADSGLMHFARTLELKSGKALAGIEGTGAAGGLALPLLAFCNAKIASGIDIVLDTAGFDEKLAGASMVITGEGRLDGQSMEGKVPVGIARRARMAGVPVIAVVGCVGEGYEKVFEEGITAVFSASSPSADFEEIKKTARRDLAILADSLFAFHGIV